MNDRECFELLFKEPSLPDDDKTVLLNPGSDRLRNHREKVVELLPEASWNEFFEGARRGRISISDVQKLVTVALSLQEKFSRVDQRTFKDKVASAKRYENIFRKIAGLLTKVGSSHPHVIQRVESLQGDLASLPRPDRLLGLLKLIQSIALRESTQNTLPLPIDQLEQVAKKAASLVEQEKGQLKTALGEISKTIPSGDGCIADQAGAWAAKFRSYGAINPNDGNLRYNQIPQREELSLPLSKRGDSQRNQTHFYSNTLLKSYLVNKDRAAYIPSKEISILVSALRPDSGYSGAIGPRVILECHREIQKNLRFSD